MILEKLIADMVYEANCASSSVDRVTGSGMRLIKCGSVVVPFDNTISKDTGLYKLFWLGIKVGYMMLGSKGIFPPTDATNCFVATQLSQFYKHLQSRIFASKSASCRCLAGQASR